MAKSKDAETLILHIPVTRQSLRDLLCTAVEGGSNYWADFSSAERTDDLDYIKVKVTEKESHADDKPRVNRYIAAEDLRNGLERLARAEFATARQHFADAISEDGGDAITADVVLQMTVFGEVIYG